MPIDTRRARPPKLSPPGHGVERRQVIVSHELAGERLDKALPALAEDVSRTLARKVIALGGVYLGLDRCKVASRKVSPGDCLTMTWHPKQQERPSFPLMVIYETAEFVVVNKAAGQHVQGTAQGDEGTLAKALTSAYGKDTQLAHRLDAPASGLILAGRTPKSVAGLMARFRDHEITRCYLALVEGRPPAGDCHLALRRDGRRMEVVAPSVEGAKAAHSHVEVLWSGEDKSLVRIQLHSGRMHQARAHLSALGAPIVGDRLYGGTAKGRLCLHAAELSWDASEDKPLSFFAAPPEDFWASLDDASGAQSVSASLARD